MRNETPDYLALLGHKSTSRTPEAPPPPVKDPRLRPETIETRARIKQYLREHGAEKVAAVAESMRLTYHTAYKYCRLLAMDGELRFTKRGGKVWVSLPTDVVGTGGVQRPAG